LAVLSSASAIAQLWHERQQVITAYGADEADIQ